MEMGRHSLLPTCSYPLVPYWYWFITFACALLSLILFFFYFIQKFFCFYYSFQQYYESSKLNSDALHVNRLACTWNHLRLQTISILPNSHWTQWIKLLKKRQFASIQIFNDELESNEKRIWVIRTRDRKINYPYSILGGCVCINQTNDCRRYITYQSFTAIYLSLVSSATLLTQ